MTILKVMCHKIRAMFVTAGRLALIHAPYRRVSLGYFRRG